MWNGLDKHVTNYISSINASSSGCVEEFLRWLPPIFPGVIQKVYEW